MRFDDFFRSAANTSEVDYNLIHNKTETEIKGTRGADASSTELTQ